MAAIAWLPSGRVHGQVGGGGGGGGGGGDFAVAEKELCQPLLCVCAIYLLASDTVDARVCNPGLLHGVGSCARLSLTCF